jgi:hypothetical protein
LDASFIDYESEENWTKLRFETTNQLNLQITASQSSLQPGLQGRQQINVGGFKKKKLPTATP